MITLWLIGALGVVAIAALCAIGDEQRREQREAHWRAVMDYRLWR